MKYYPTTRFLLENAQFIWRTFSIERETTIRRSKIMTRFWKCTLAETRPRAQLKKGYALLELGQRYGRSEELNSLVQRYPRSIEAQQARERLRKLGATASTKPSASRP